MFLRPPNGTPFSHSSWDSLDGVVAGSGGASSSCITIFSFIVCPSVLDDLPPLVTVASSSSCPNLLRVFNDIVRVSKIAAYLLRGEVHVDFSGSNVDDCFNGVKERSLKDDGWIVLVFSHVNNLQPFGMFDLLSGAECVSVLGAWFRTETDR